MVTAYLLGQTVVTPLFGKLGDLYGRKGVMQSAIVIFLAGSMLCGIASNMTQLIAYRALQGLGGGGLLVTTQAIVGDIVAMLVLAVTLPARTERVRHAIDYTGAALLACRAERDRARRRPGRNDVHLGIALHARARRDRHRVGDRQDPGSDPGALGRSYHIDDAKVDGAIEQLTSRGLIAARQGENGQALGFGVTRAGCEVLGRLIAVRRTHLAEAAAEWRANGAPDVAEVREVARELVPDARASVNAGDATDAASRTRSTG